MLVAQAGVYGTQDGTSYDNAWNGFVSIVWGGAGVVAGDTLYICDRHLHNCTNGTAYSLQGRFTNAVSGTLENPINIRMDYTGHKGELWGAWFDNRGIYGDPTVWDGPDANGVYWTTAIGTQLRFQERNGVISLLKLKETNTWSGDEGYCYFVSSPSYTNFVKSADGTPPTNSYSRGGAGYALYLGTNSYIRFINCNFYSSTVYADQFVTEDDIIPSHHITFDGCLFEYDSVANLYGGYDYWTYTNCTFRTNRYGVYTSRIGTMRGPNNLLVSHCTFTNMGDSACFPNNDGHACGIQATCNSVWEYNTTRDTGESISLFTGAQYMTNNDVRYNDIADVRVEVGGTSGHGIAISGSVNATPGYRTGNRIYGNLIRIAGLGATETYHGAGISSNSEDPAEIYNNTILHCNNGIRIMVNSYPYAAYIRNNLILSPTNNYLLVGGTGAPTNWICDYNLYSPTASTNSGFTVGPDYGSHNVFSDPLLTGDYRLTAASPAINAGTDVGLPFQGASPDIGAYEWQSPSVLRSLNLSAGTLRGK